MKDDISTLELLRYAYNATYHAIQISYFARREYRDIIEED